MARKKSKPAPTTPHLETMLLSALMPHPDQQRFFRAYGDYEYEALKRDIQSNGLAHPIVVLPPRNAAGLPAYTILAGHTRRKILLELEHTTTTVLVRYDLIAASRSVVDEFFILDNVARRQQDRLGQARAAVALYQIEREKAGRASCNDPLKRSDLRDRIGKILNMSGRNLSRYISVLAAPTEVQDAFSAEAITLVAASRVGTLKPVQREQLAVRLRRGESAKAVFAEFFPPPCKKHVKSGDALTSFVKSLTAAHDDLDDRVETVGVRLLRKHEPELRKAMHMLQKLLKRSKLPIPPPIWAGLSEAGTA
jgi:ParB-like chromosome segregation protein Spo0J